MYVDVVDVVDIDTNVLYVYRNVDIVDTARSVQREPPQTSA